MKTSVYPVPCDEESIEELIDPFLETEINQRAFSKDDLFMILLLDPSTSEYEGSDGDVDYEDLVENHINNKESRIREAYALDQLTVTPLDERRLNNFAISLLYNVLEQDPTTDPTSILLNEENLTDEDIRKIDYYLPKINDQIQNLITEHQQEFKEQISSLFPVSLNDQATSQLHNRVNDQIQSHGAIIDYFIFAAAADEDENGVRSLLGSIRDMDLDEELLSGERISEISGYQRIIENSYTKQQSEFFDDFETAINLYRDSTTNAELLRILRKLDSDISIDPDQNQNKSIYLYEPVLTQLLTAQIDGNNQIAQWLLQAINIIRLVQDNEESVLDSYREQHNELENLLDDIDSKFSNIDDLQEYYPREKLNYDDTTINYVREMIRGVELTNSLLIKFVFGYDRGSRTSAYTTAQTRLKDTQQKIDSGIGKLRTQTKDIKRLEERLEGHLDTIDQLYEDIEETSVDVDLPDRDNVKEAFRNEWSTKIETLKQDLPMLDFSSKAEDIRQTQQEHWQQMISETQTELQSLEKSVNDLSKFRDQIQEVEEVREDTRKEFQQIHAKMERDEK
ncbi:MAG: hypothetical protein ABEI86_01225 [Halobacteriaceae archaeon]